MLVHHNYLSEWETNPFCLEYDPQTGMGLFSFIATGSIYCILKKDGTVIPVCGNILAERLSNRIQTSLIIVPDTVKQEYEDRVRVLDVSPEVEGLKKGDVVAILEKADYEICYSWENNDYSVIKVFQDEVVGVLEAV